MIAAERADERQYALGDLLRYFLRLGAVGFGGPTAGIGNTHYGQLHVAGSVSIVSNSPEMPRPCAALIGSEFAKPSRAKSLSRSACFG